MECNGEDDSKGIRKRKAKLPLKEESRDNGEKKENPDETVSMHHKPIPASGSFALYCNVSNFISLQREVTASLCQSHNK